MTLLLALCVVNMLLRQLGTQCGDFVLQRGDFVVVLLFHASHSSFNLANILPHIDMVTHDLTCTTATATVARETARL